MPKYVPPNDFMKVASAYVPQSKWESFVKRTAKALDNRVLGVPMTHNQRAALLRNAAVYLGPAALVGVGGSALLGSYVARQNERRRIARSLGYALPRWYKAITNPARFQPTQMHATARRNPLLHHPNSIMRKIPHGRPQAKLAPSLVKTYAAANDPFSWEARVAAALENQPALQITTAVPPEPTMPPSGLTDKLRGYWRKAARHRGKVGFGIGTALGVYGTLKGARAIHEHNEFIRKRNRAIRDREATWTQYLPPEVDPDQPTQANFMLPSGAVVCYNALTETATVLTKAPEVTAAQEGLGVWRRLTSGASRAWSKYPGSLSLAGGLAAGTLGTLGTLQALRQLGKPAKPLPRAIGPIDDDDDDEFEEPVKWRREPTAPAVSAKVEYTPTGAVYSPPTDDDEDEPYKHKAKTMHYTQSGAAIRAVRRIADYAPTEANQLARTHSVMLLGSPIRDVINKIRNLPPGVKVAGGAGLVALGGIGALTALLNSGPQTKRRIAAWQLGVDRGRQEREGEKKPIGALGAYIANRVYGPEYLIGREWGRGRLAAQGIEAIGKAAKDTLTAIDQGGNITINW